MHPAEGFLGFSGMHKLGLYPLCPGQVQKKLSKGRFSCIITTTCCIGLGTVPELVDTVVSVPVVEKLDVRCPVEFEIVSVERLCVLERDAVEVAVLTEVTICWVLVEACKTSYPESTEMVRIAAITTAQPIFLLRAAGLRGMSAMAEKASPSLASFAGSK